MIRRFGGLGKKITLKKGLKLKQRRNNENLSFFLIKRKKNFPSGFMVTRELNSSQWNFTQNYIGYLKYLKLRGISF